MLKKSLKTILCVVLAAAAGVFAQETWIRQYGLIGSDRVYSLDLTPDGSYIAAGRTTSFNDWSYEDGYLLRIDLHGDTLWTKHYGGEYDERFYSVKTTSDSGYVMAGYTEGTDTLDLDYYIVKTKSDGEIVWEKTYGGASRDTAYCICELSGGGYVVVGNTASYGGGGTDIWLLRLDSSGDTLWTRTFGGDGSDLAYGARQTSDGGFMIAGRTRSFGLARCDVYLVKTDEDGNVSAVGEQPQQSPLRMEINGCEICYDLPYGTNVSLAVYDASGRLVSTLVQGKVQAGVHTIRWEGKDNINRKCSSGVYFVRFVADDYRASKKMVMLK